MSLIDSHVHLNDRRFQDDIGAVINSAHKAGVSHMINVGSNIATSKLAVKQSHQFKGLSAAVGIHPHHADTYNQKSIKEIEALLSDKKVVAWGEIGLDYHYDFSPRQQQMKAFTGQLELIARHKVPVIIHNRESHHDMLRTLADWKGSITGVMHCYSGSAEMARSFLDLGYYISIAGPVTFKNARKLLDVVKYVPLESLLIETDCPYLTPVPYRGKRNEPAYVVEIARKIAEIKGLDFETVARQTTENAIKLFKLGKIDA